MWTQRSHTWRSAPLIQANGSDPPFPFASWSVTERLINQVSQIFIQIASTLSAKSEKPPVVGLSSGITGLWPINCLEEVCQITFYFMCAALPLFLFS